MFRFVLFVLLAVGYSESITVDELYHRVKQLEISVKSLTAQNGELAAKNIQLEQEIKDSGASIRRDLDQGAWKEKIFMKHSHGPDGVVIPDITATVVSSTISTIYSSQNTADKATDNKPNSFASTNFEKTPVYTAQLDSRFKGIQLNITGYTHFPCLLTIYTVDNGVETICSQPEMDKAGTYWKTVGCKSSGSGFKIVAQNKDGKLLRLIIYEIDMEIVI